MSEWKITLQDREVQRFRVMDGETIVVGRSSEADVTVDNPGVSRRHLSFQGLNGAVFVNDLGSTNGTTVNGQKLVTALSVGDQDRIQLGKFTITATVPPAVTAGGASDLDSTVFLSTAPRPQSAVPQRPPRLTVVQGRAEPAGCSTEGRDRITVGKGGGADLRVGGFGVGSLQCEILRVGDTYHLAHRSGWRATTRNGKRVRGSVELARGDVIGVAGTRLRFD